MSKFAVALALMLIAAPAAAKDKVEPRLAAILACGSVASNEERLRCYDAAASTMKVAIEKGEVEVNQSPRPQALVGVVKASGPFGYNRYWVELVNGDRWQITSEQTFDEAPPAGVKVKLERGAMGSYWMVVPDARDRRASFLGNRS